MRTCLTATLIFAFTITPCLLMVETAPAQVDAQGLSFRLKTAFLYKIASEITWPEESSKLMRIQVLGGGPWASALKGLQGRELNGKRIIVDSIDSPRELDAPAILVLTKGNSDQIRAAVSRLGEGATLIVGEDDDTLKQGGAVRLFVADKKVQFDLSQSALVGQHLSASPDLVARAEKG